MLCHSLQTGQGCSGRLRFLFSMSFATSNSPMHASPSAPPHQAGHHHFAVQPPPEVVHQPFYFVCADTRTGTAPDTVHGP